MKLLKVVALAALVGLMNLPFPAAALDEPSEPNVLILLSANLVSGQGWVVDDVVEFYFNGDYVATAVAEPNAEGSGSPVFDLDDLGITALPGDEIELVRPSDGYRTGVHVITPLAVNLASAKKDIVAGTAEPGSQVLVAIRPDDNQPLVTVDRYVIADEDGEWLADFSKVGTRPDEQAVFDFGADSYGFAIQVDENENATADIWVPTVTSKAQCKNGGWQDFGIFKNQGDCQRHVP